MSIAGHVSRAMLSRYSHVRIARSMFILRNNPKLLRNSAERSVEREGSKPVGRNNPDVTLEDGIDLHHVPGFRNRSIASRREFGIACRHLTFHSGRDSRVHSKSSAAYRSPDCHSLWTGG